MKKINPHSYNCILTPAILAIHEEVNQKLREKDITTYELSKLEDSKKERLQVSGSAFWASGSAKNLRLNLLDLDTELISLKQAHAILIKLMYKNGVDVELISYLEQEFTYVQSDVY